VVPMAGAAAPELLTLIQKGFLKPNLEQQGDSTSIIYELGSNVSSQITWTSQHNIHPAENLTRGTRQTASRRPKDVVICTLLLVLAEIAVDAHRLEKE
jgi:hypothetical protein